MSDTIAAIATATGAAGIGIVRISGPEALGVAERLARGAKRGKPFTLRRVTVRDPRTGEALDDTLLAVFHAPRSLTGENVVEIQGHGGTVTLGRVLAACFAAGARAARPGEFTERAFRNGKMDLAQAEAVAALVSSQTVAAQRAALGQISGALSRRVNEAASALEESLAQIEASIDFPEEIGDADPLVVDAPLERAETILRALLSTAGYGRRLQEGITLVLAGRPNVGKSSLLNALSGTERAIVTPIPGTTRDIIEEALNFQGLPIRALDTAGIRDTDDPVEEIGVARARQAARSADVVVAVLDAAAGVGDEDAALLQSLAGQRCVIAINKADMVSAQDLSETERAARALQAPTPEAAVVTVSAQTRHGLDKLSDAVVRAVTGSDSHIRSDSSETADIASTAVVTSARHAAALEAALLALRTARTTLIRSLPLELVAVDVHGALQSLGEITGAATREEIIAGIFARFCLGK